MNRILPLVACCTLLLIAATTAAGQAVLTPGSGWSGDPIVADAVGASGDPGYEATVIARWDCVPRQTFGETFGVGLLAFHINGIDRVEFSVEGGPWVAVTEMTLNPRTDAWEYWVTLDAALFDAAQEGTVEVRAVAYPKTAGQPRVLADGSATQVDRGDGSMRLVVDKGTLQHPVVWVDDDGSDTDGDGSQASPYRTIDHAIAAAFPHAGNPWDPDTTGVLDGATIYLGEGTYTMPEGGYYDMQRWVTITNAPNARPSHVIFSSNWKRCNIQLLHMKDVTWQPSSDVSFVRPQRADREAWFDGVRGIGGGRDSYGAPWTNGSVAAYYTDCTVHDFRQGVQAANGAVYLARGVDITHIHEDAFRMNKMILNCTVDDVDKEGSDAHPDLVQHGGGEARNFIICNLKATDNAQQGIYIRGVDWAIVNVFAELKSGWGYLWQIDKIDRVQHCLIWHCGTLNQNLAWRTGDGTANCRDISIRNCALKKMYAGTDSQGQPTDAAYLRDVAMTVDNCHFKESSFAEGTRATFGSPMYELNAVTGDYQSDPDSQLVDRVDELLVPFDIHNHPRQTPGAVGPFAQRPQRLNLYGTPSGARFTLSTDRVWPDDPGEAHVCLWDGDRYAAMSVTIDDNMAVDHQWWLDTLGPLDMHVTWFAITGRIGLGGYWGTWPGFQTLLDAGHDVQSHTVTHLHHEDPGWVSIEWEYTHSIEQIEENMPPHRCIALAYPGGGNSYLNDSSIAAKYFFAARGVSGHLNKANEINYLSTGSVGGNVGRDVTDAILYGTSGVPWFGNNKYLRAWACTHFHGAGDEATRAANAANLAYIKSMESEIWFALFADALKYGQQRDTARLAVTENTAERIRFTLTDQMLDALFDYPLTIKVRLPAAWSSASAVQNGQTVPCTTVDHNGDLFALVKAVPDRGEVTLTELPLSFQITRWYVAAAHAGQGTVAVPVTDGYIEPRAAGLQELQVGFSRPADPGTASPAAVMITGAASGDQSSLIDTVTLSPDGMTLTAMLASPLPDADTYTIGLTAALRDVDGSTLTGDADLTLAALVGDVNGSGMVSDADVVTLRAAGGLPGALADWRNDLDGSGQVSGADMALARARVGNQLY